MITADLDTELATALRALTVGGELPAAVAQVAPTGTWRPGPDGDPSSYSTAAPFQIAGPAGLAPAQVAAAVAGSLGAVPWIEAAKPSGGGYLTITVTHEALAASAERMAAAGHACANSAILRGTVTTSLPWPDLAAARSWQHAWQLQADAMTSHLGQAAGASAPVLSGRERASANTRTDPAARSPLLDEVAFFGSDSVRYRLARTMPGQRVRPASLLVAGIGIAQPGTRLADPLYPVQQAHAAAASTLRWAADLGQEPAGTADGIGRQLRCPAERALLGLLSFLPVRAAAAARRGRPDELPRYLEQVSAAWLACRQQAPALPFGGAAASADPEVRGARLTLASAVAAVLGAGLALTGIAARDRL